MPMLNEVANLFVRIWMNGEGRDVAAMIEVIGTMTESQTGDRF
jgi:hypothetical protein